MKIRTDFVTNSSSSSFVIMCKKVNLKDVDLNKGKFIGIGKYLGDGRDIFELNQNMVEYLTNKFIIEKLTDSYDEKINFYKLFASFDGEANEEENEITFKELSEKIEDLEEKIRILNVEWDYHSSEDEGDLEYRYFNDNDDDDY